MARTLAYTPTGQEIEVSDAFAEYLTETNAHYEVIQ